MTDVRSSDVKARKPRNKKTYAQAARGNNHKEVELVLRVRQGKGTIVSHSRSNLTLLVIYYLFLFVSILAPSTGNI
jgi:hypothetical protein